MAIKNLKSIKTKDNTYIVADKVTLDDNVLNFWKSLTAPETEDTLVYSVDLSNFKTTEYDFSYDVETGLFALLEDGEVKTEATILSGSGGSGGSTSVVKLTNQNGTSVFAVASGSKVELMFNFTSTEDDIPTGNGICQIIVNSITKTTLNITQGLTTVDVSEYLSAGSNTVRVRVTDVYGNSKTLVYTVSVIDLYLTSTFDATTPYSGEIIFKYIPYGAIEKTVHLLVDGKEVETLTTSVSGKQATTTFSAMSHGVHTIEVYMDAEMDGLALESEHLIYEIICIADDETTPMIASVYNVESVQQGTQVSIPYIVYDPTKLACDITLTVISNETVVSTTELTVDRSQQLWNTRKYPVGVVTFKISYGDIYKSHTITVTESDIDVEAVTNDLELYLTSAGRSNGEANPASWDYGDISTSFENFNWSSVGWINDENGDTCLRLNGDAKAEIQFQPFSKDLRTYGKTIELEFAIRDVNNRDAVAISCMSGDIGFEVKSDTAYIKSEQSKVFCNYKEEKRVRLSFVIESRSEYRLLSIYLNGILSDTVKYPSTDNFTQSSPVNISIGSPYCGVDLYTIRSYTTALTSPSIVTNYIADMTDIVRKTEAYEQNDIYDDYGNISFEKTKDKNSIMIIIGELPQSKGDKKTVTIVYYDVENSTLDFEEAEVTIDIQGTSSQFFIRKNWKLKFPSKHYIDLNQLPAKVICIKVDYAEATGTHNTQNANFIETLYDEQIPPQADEPNVRTTIYGKPILLFHQENENATPVFYGKANFNTDKGAEDTFGFTKDYDVESWEFLNNTSDACNFLGEIPENWGDDFEARYPDGCSDISNFKKIHDWVVSTKDDVEKFKNEFEDYFNLHYALIYYVYTFFALMVDQRAKNMFITIWNGIGYIYFYDNDTCFGINNEGQLVFDYYHEDIDQLDGANVYNGQNSVLWCNFREAFADEIKEMYQTLRSSKKITYDKLIERFITNGSNKWSESIYNEDSEFKYISMLKSDDDASNLGQVRGSGEEHFAYFIENRINYCDSKWYASDYADDYVSLRIYTPSEWAGIEPNADITVTPYSNMYAGARYKANGTLYQERAWHNVPVTFKAPNETFNDTETGIYGASQLSSLGDLAPLYCGSINVSKANKIVILKVGDGTEGYVNTNLKELSVGTNRLLKIIDVQNCPNLATALGLANCPNIEEIYAKGSGITGVELPESGFLKIIELPATVANLTLKNQLYIETLTLEGYDSLKTLWIENCPTIDSLDILDKGTNIERVRLTNVNWSYDDASFLYELINRNIAGIDENGANIDTMWINGTCHIKSLTGAEMAILNANYPYLTITYDTLESQLIFMNDDGTTELCRQTIVNGGNGVDPIINGTISTPTKTATAQYTFIYIGWSTKIGGSVSENALKAVTADRYVYATFSATIRCYTVKFYNGSTLLQTLSIEYGSDAVYTGSTPTKTNVDNSEDYEFIGWNPSPENITEDTSCYAQYVFIGYIEDSWRTIAENVAKGRYTSLYGIGALKELTVTYEDGTTETLNMEIADFDHDDLADDSGKAGITFISQELLSNGKSMNNTQKTYNGVTNYTAGGWSLSDLRTYCNEDLFSYLPSEVQSVILEVTKVSDTGYVDANLLSTVDKLFTLSSNEVGLSSNVEPQGIQYPIFTDASSRKKYKVGATSPAHWWLRSVRRTSDFCNVDASGSLDYSTSLSSLGVVFGFCIGKAPVIADTSWENIFASIDDGSYATKYAVGQIMPLDLGTETVYMQIAAIDTDILADGSGTAPITWISREILATSHRMNPNLVTNYEYPDSPSWVGNNSNASWVTQTQYCVDSVAKATWTITATTDGTLKIQYKTSNATVSNNKMTLTVNGETVVEDYANTTYATYEVACSAGDEVVVAASYALLISQSYTSNINFTSTGTFSVSANVENAPKRVLINHDMSTGTIGGWENSEMRTYMKETIKPMIPENVRNRIREVIKYTRIFDESGTAVNNVETTDDVWIPSNREVFCNASYDTLGVMYSGLFTDASSRKKYKVGATSPAYWWLRSASYANGFCYVYTSGSWNHNGSSISYGVVLGFCT